MKKMISLLLILILTLGAVSALADPPTQTEGIDVPVIDDIKKFEIPDNDAMAFVKDMKCGWNLGNTFDAYNGYVASVKGIEMESSWVSVKTSRTLIHTIKEAGFNTIRIPVSWHNHVDEDYQINTEWMARVREVIDWALEEDMYVIVNVHHDNHKRFMYPDEEHFERSAAYLTAIWTQMAEEFKDCDDHLILESLNEPRLVDTQYEWNWTSNSKECQEAADCINRLNQLFVETVRATGGNNETRYLAVPAYCGAPWNAVADAFKLPVDTAENKIIIECHAYSPYNFALNTGSTDRRFDLDKDKNKQSEIAGIMNSLYERFVKAGVPVVMDEFGALDKNGNLQDRVNFTAYYVASASARGITCVWWDNHVFNGTGERFGLIKRLSCAWVYPDIVLAMMNNCLYNRE